MKEEFKYLQPGDPEYWAERARTGARALREVRTIKQRKKLIETPERMWQLACEYFQRVDDTPLYKTDFLRGGAEAGKEIKIKVDRPYSWMGFEDYLFEKGIIGSTLEKYRYNYNGYYTEYEDVVRAINSVMRTNKFDGAVVGIFNPALISQDLGMVSKTQAQVLTHSTDPIDYSKLSTEALEELAEAQKKITE